MKNPFMNKIYSWTKVQSQPFKLDIFHKLDWQVVFDNQMTQVFKELFLLHIITFEKIFCNNFLK